MEDGRWTHEPRLVYSPLLEVVLGQKLSIRNESFFWDMVRISLFLFVEWLRFTFFYFLKLQTVVVTSMTHPLCVSMLQVGIDFGCWSQTWQHSSSTGASRQIKLRSLGNDGFCMILLGWFFWDIPMLSVFNHWICSTPLLVLVRGVALP